LTEVQNRGEEGVSDVSTKHDGCRIKSNNFVVGKDNEMLFGIFA